MINNPEPEENRGAVSVSYIEQAGHTFNNPQLPSYLDLGLDKSAIEPFPAEFAKLGIDLRSIGLRGEFELSRANIHEF